MHIDALFAIQVRQCPASAISFGGFTAAFFCALGGAGDCIAPAKRRTRRSEAFLCAFGGAGDCSAPAMYRACRSEAHFTRFWRGRGLFCFRKAPHPSHGGVFVRFRRGRGLFCSRKAPHPSLRGVFVRFRRGRGLFCSCKAPHPFHGGAFFCLGRGIVPHPQRAAAENSAAAPCLGRSNARLRKFLRRRASFR